MNCPQSILTQLIDQVRSHDKGALEELLKRLYPRVQAQVHRQLRVSVRGKRPWLHGLFSTNDLVQEVLIGACRTLPKLEVRCEAGLIQYLATLCRNRIIDTIRFYEATRRDQRRVGSGRDELAGLHAPNVGPEENAHLLEQVRSIHEVLESFAERDRILLRERLENRTPYEELSTTLGYASADSARKAFCYAQAKLLAALQGKPS